MIRRMRGDMTHWLHFFLEKMSIVENIQSFRMESGRKKWNISGYK